MYSLFFKSLIINLIRLFYCFNFLNTVLNFIFAVMEVIEKTHSERVKILARLVKLRDYEFLENTYIQQQYHIKFDELKEKFNISDQELKEYEEFILIENHKLKQELNKKSFFYNGIKFKDESNFKEYLAKMRTSAQLKFLFKGALNKVLLNLNDNVILLTNFFKSII